MENKERPMILKRVSNYISGHAKHYGPHVGLTIMRSVVIAVLGHFYVTHRDQKLKEAVYRKITHGSRPELLYGDIVIPRKTMNF